VVEVWRQLGRDEVGFDADRGFDSRISEALDPAATDEGVGIDDANDHACHPRVDEGLGARAGSTGVVARLESGVHRGAARRYLLLICGS
jgi:hypothetical protein